MLASLVEELFDIIANVSKASNGKTLALHEPYLESNVLDELSKTVASGFVSSVGEAVTEFETLLSNYTGAEAVILTSSGTAALQLALRVSGVKAGDEVAMPALSFVATANAAKLLGAEPVFVDTEPLSQNSTLGMSAESLEELLTSYFPTEVGPINRATGARLGAVVPVHVFGRLSTSKRLVRLAKDWKIPIVEDAAGAIGCFSEEGMHPGTESPAILSFNGNKTITTGGGGALLLPSSDLAVEARHLATTAKVPHPWRFQHDRVAWNFRMPALNASLGVAQMRSLPRILDAKRRLAARYFEEFLISDNFCLLDTPPGQRSNHWLIAAALKEPSEVLLGELLDSLNARGVGVRSAWSPINLQLPYLSSQRVALNNTTEIVNSVVCLPSSPQLGMNA